MKSPDGNIIVNFEVADTDSCAGCPAYSVKYKDLMIIGPSGLGVTLSDGKELNSGFAVSGVEESSSDTSWKPVFGERSIIRDNYNQYVFSLRREGDYAITYSFRVFDAGVALRYTVSDEYDAPVEISVEETEIQFPKNFSAWQGERAQSLSEKKPLTRIWSEVERPLVVELKDNLFVAITEAANVDFPRMKIALASKKPPRLVSALSGPAAGNLPLTSPWRVIMVAESPGELLENNDIILNLNEPCAIEDTSWIKPGKVFREVTLTTKGGLAAVDFAAAHNMEFILFDAGWYGPENNPASDATTVTVDIKRSTGPLDLQKVIDYGKKKGVGVILYVNHRALEQQLDELLPLYKEWGVAGIKFGFVNVGPQEWTQWLHEAIRKCAEYQIMVDVHDEYRPTGYSRTYPNFVTMEGIRGDEERQPPSSSLATLFTRMIAGPADNTFCYFDSRVTEQANHAYQLAKSVAFYSPWQVLFWYDRPSNAPRKAGGAGSEKNVIIETPELVFWDNLPVTWDESRVLSGEIGRHAVIARRTGDTWYIAALAAEGGLEYEVDLSELLEAGESYTSTTYTHDPIVDTPTHVRIDTTTVKASDKLKINIGDNDGMAAVIKTAE